MAEKRTINIDINSNASEAEKDFKSFNKAVDETTKSAKNLDATFEEVYGELQPLTTRMGEAEDRLYELALAGDTASKEYQELLTKVGEYRKVQIQTDLAVDGAAQTMTQKLGSALNGATSGFAATQGAMALFGSENQALEQSLLKVQSALAIQQGVKGLSDAYKELSIATKIAAAVQAAFTFVTGGATIGLKLLRLALISTGIGALVVAVGLLIANFDKLLIPLNAAKNALKAFGDAIGLTNFKQQKAEEELEEKREENAKKQLARYEAEKQAINNQIDNIKRLSKLRQKNIEEEIRLLVAQGKETTKLERLKLTEGLNTLKLLLKAEKEKADLAAKNLKNATGLERVLANMRLKQIEEQELKIRIFDAETNKEKANNYREYAAQRLSIARQIEDIENGLLKDGIEKELEINRDKFRRLREDAEKNTKLTRTERARLIELFDEQELAQQKVIDAKYEKIRQDKIDKEKAELQELVDFNEELRLKEIEDNKAKNLQIIEDNKAAAAKQKEIDEKAAQEKADRQNAAIDLAVQGFQLIAGIAEAFAGEDEKRQKKAFQIKKVADIAAATVDGYRAVLSTYAQTPGGPILKGIAAGLAGSFAALQIANIAKQQFQGGGDGADVAVSADAGGGESVTPQFNVVGDSGINQLAQLQQQPTQAYVVSGEVTTSQALDRNRVQNATL